MITQTGSTAHYLSRLNFPCPILAICDNYQLARSLLLSKNVQTLNVFSLVGHRVVVQKALNYAKKEKLVRKGDKVFLLRGKTHNMSGTIDTVSFIVVD